MNDFTENCGYTFKRSYSNTNHGISDTDGDSDQSDSIICPKKTKLDEKVKKSISRIESCKNYDKKTSNYSNSQHTLSDSGSDDNVSSSDLAHRSSVKKEASNISIDKPVCKYGLNCYKKSDSHFKKYLHLNEFKKSESNSSNVSLRANLIDTIDGGRPYNFFLTSVTGIDDMFNNKAIHIKDILSPQMGNLMKSAQFNYCIDITWLCEQYPVEFKTKPLLIVHGFQREEKKGLEKEARIYPHISLCKAPLEIPYGTHHTKMMFLLYDNGLRVVISTANLVEKDWYQKTQGVWISDVFPKLTQSDDNIGESPTYFKRDLIEYLRAYNAVGLNEWIDVIKMHDFSEAKVFLIGSVPGRHQGSLKNNWGHMKMRKILNKHGQLYENIGQWHLLAQFSSVGSLGLQKENWFCGEWMTSLGACNSSVKDLRQSNLTIKLIFPDKETIRTSLEGYPAGQSVPYSIETAKKQTYMAHFWHHWRSKINGRSRAIPHIKTYTRVSPDYTKLAWFLVTSANMSKAAWGAFEKGGSQLMIRSYELGVLFLPELYNKTVFSTKDINIPYDLPPIKYGPKERPWVWDIPYTDKPDTHGNMWCPAL